MLSGALPSFGLTALDWGLTLARAVSEGALFLVFGTLLLRVVIASPMLASCPPAEARLARLLRAALGTSAAGTLAWLGLQTAVLADAATLRETLANLASVLTGTEFGTLIIARLSLLGIVAALLAVRRHWTVIGATGLAAVAVGLQAGHLHALAMYRGPSLLLASEVAHLLAAAAWLGGLPGLLCVVRVAPPPRAALAAARFSPLGVACVLTLAVSAGWQSWSLLGGVPGALGTAYGWVCLGKALLFAGLLACAVRNRFHLLPRLARTASAGARRALARSIALESALGLLVVLLAALLGFLQPGMHLQPIWPFSARLSFAPLSEDAALAWEAGLAGAALLGALGLAALALLRRRWRWRWAALLAAAAAAWFAASHSSFLFVPAPPTAFYRSPTQFAADSIADGAALFARNCTRCHGAQGRGDGPDAALLPIRPADLTSAHLWMHSDGELFWWLTAGVTGPEGETAMPGFGAMLAEEERWALIDYVRARNAGATYAATGAWTSPVLAPSFLADCGGAQALPVGEPGPFARRVLFLSPVRPGPVAAPERPEPGLVTILIPPERVMLRPTGVACVASDPAIRTAYAVVAGLPAARVEGMQALIDTNGWLRAFETAGPPSAAALRQLAAPLPRGTVFALPHHH